MMTLRWGAWMAASDCQQPFPDHPNSLPAFISHKEETMVMPPDFEDLFETPSVE
jgi:hypothetical protein